MDSPAEYTVTVAPTLDEVAEADWDALAGGNPFVTHRFLSLMGATGCAAPKTGWHPQFLLLYRSGVLVGAVPSYLKTHSRGEFVFDQSWAQAFEQHGLAYYPKLLVASPFTPVQGPRLLAMDDEARAALAQSVAHLCVAAETSSAHALFVEEQDRAALVAAGFMVREGVQFHWRNEGYASTDDFLARLSHDKRKKLKQDSRYVAEAGITYEWLEGDALTEEHLEFFYGCYANTYREHWSTPYLSLEFFKRAHSERALHLVLMLASREGKAVACALNVRGEGALYGRYWGATEFVKGLHFESCYMQSIAYCISHGVAVFEGGAQGEHKMSRGLMPTKTYSAHWVADRRFAAAIEDFLERETAAVNGYVEELERASPFKR
ncbi:MAG: GNAT family N-acetyltransferase [Comamonas sp.]|uniref:GNAT family N-acetyltransferase n=1 Tax=Comamonas sp. TaxID=34028 RepID=UPI00264780E1|nr:GNAT family N-acetyltransferase [Comamonas sp.]MDN5503352.1 GNAT family N-acetyltransferase [Comamonas sp.]MDN5536850.1 GNAT family N-acetyltransferase [Comamonas sp.]